MTEVYVKQYLRGACETIRTYPEKYFYLTKTSGKDLNATFCDTFLRCNKTPVEIIAFYYCTIPWLISSKVKHDVSDPNVNCDAMARTARVLRGIYPSKILDTVPYLKKKCPHCML